VKGNEKDPLHGRGAGTAGWGSSVTGIKASLIDLHRAQLRAKTPRRWMVKDLAGLWFSAMDTGLTQRDRFRFMKIYRGKSLRPAWKKDMRFWKTVERTACRLYLKEKKRLKR
jgi:heptose I phosphotransferase